jgi:hemerythrin
MVVVSSGHSEDAVLDVLDELFSYAQVHFFDEEKHMESVGLDPRYQQFHKDQHQDFIQGRCE